MKAGAFTPAIRFDVWSRVNGGSLNEGGGGSARRRVARGPLNEGGGFHPRDPATNARTAASSDSLNEGGGFHPRDPQAEAAADAPQCDAQ